MSTEITPITRIIEATDAWGHLHRARVTWLPERLVGLDAARDNLGRTQVAWEDEDDCPIYWVADPSTACMRLRPVVREYTGDIAMDVRAYRADSVDELEPGTYYHEVL